MILWFSHFIFVSGYYWPDLTWPDWGQRSADFEIDIEQEMIVTLKLLICIKQLLIFI